MAVFAREDIGDETGRKGMVVFSFKPFSEFFLACIWIEAFSGLEGGFLGGRDGLLWWHVS